MSAMEPDRASQTFQQVLELLKGPTDERRWEMLVLNLPKEPH